MKITASPKAPEEKGILFVSLLADSTDSYIRETAEGKKELLLGIGNPKEISHRKFIILARQIIAQAKNHRAKHIACSFSALAQLQKNSSPSEIAELLVVNFEMANFEYVEYKTPPEEGWNFIEEVTIYDNATAEVKTGIERGQIIAEGINGSRTLANTPGGEMTPALLAKAAQDAAHNTSIKVEVLLPKQIQELKMGGVLGVSKGSAEEPRFIIMDYRGGGAKDKPIVLVGKGVTFDTGGLNLKPSEAIYEMHMDMSGGAAVIHTVAIAAKLKLNVNVVGLIPAVENMPSGSSYHPGDVLRTMSGKTIEVLNTDAEGRVILADALAYASRYNPQVVVDVATLTGAAMVALGQRASAVFTEDETLEKQFRELGEKSGDYVWPLPLWDEYTEDIKGTFGDWANAGKNRYGGAITAALFLKQFAEGYPWVHLDIAPRMTAAEGEFLAKGSVGAPIRLLIKLLER